MKNRFKYSLILLLVVAAGVFSQPVKLDSVNDAIEYALHNNPDMEIYKLNMDKAKKDYNAVKNYRMPTLSASFSGVDNISLPVTKIPGEIFGQPGTTIEAEFGQQYDYKTGLNISKSILDFQSRFTAKVAKVNIEMAEADQDAYKQKLVEQVALYYFTAIIIPKALKVQEADYKAANDVLVLFEQKFEQGIVDQHTVNLAKLNKNNIRQNINSYQIVLAQCHANLKILFGLDAETEIVINENLESVTDKIPYKNFIDSNKNLKVYKLQLKQSDYRVKQQRALWLPKLSINLYRGAQQYRDDFGISFSDSDWSKISYISLNLSIPIFNKFSTKNKVNSALIDYNISRSVLEKELIKSKIEDELILKEFNHSREAADAANDNYRIAKENAGLQFQKLEQGIVSLDQYLDSFDDYLKAEVTFLNLLSDSYNYYSKILSRDY